MIVDDGVATEVVGEDAKKRGRKPRGAKVIPQSALTSGTTLSSKNVVLHLKAPKVETKPDVVAPFEDNVASFTVCEPAVSLPRESELIQNGVVSNTKGDNFSIQNFNLMFDKINNRGQTDLCETVTTTSSIIDDATYKQTITKSINDKLRELEYKLHKNNITDKKSDCFWCNHPFDTMAVYIPRHEVKGRIEVYGCFCSPECAVGFLMREKIDTSVRFQRYELLNNLYKDAYGYKTPIKQAPEPYYLLKKYFGTLTIDEYRALSSVGKNLMVISKPLSKIYPELHDEVPVPLSLNINNSSSMKAIADANVVSNYSSTLGMPVLSDVADVTAIAPITTRKKATEGKPSKQNVLNSVFQ